MTRPKRYHQGCWGRSRGLFHTVFCRRRGPESLLTSQSHFRVWNINQDAAACSSRYLWPINFTTTVTCPLVNARAMRQTWNPCIMCLRKGQTQTHLHFFVVSHHHVVVIYNNLETILTVQSNFFFVKCSREIKGRSSTEKCHFQMKSILHKSKETAMCHAFSGKRLQCLFL